MATPCVDGSEMGSQMDTQQVNTDKTLTDSSDGNISVELLGINYCSQLVISHISKCTAGGFTSSDDETGAVKATQSILSENDDSDVDKAPDGSANRLQKSHVSVNPGTPFIARERHATPRPTSRYPSAQPLGKVR